MDLESALRQFDAVEANLRRLEKVWNEIQELTPSGISFDGGSPEYRRYQELARAFATIGDALPPIEGVGVKSRPLGLNEIGQARLDAQEVDEISLIVSVEEEVNRPGLEIDEYRSRLDRTRRDLVRDAMNRLIGQVDDLLAQIQAASRPNEDPIETENWQPLVDAFGQVERLAGGQIPRKGRWSDMRRHLAFGQAHDLTDIVRADWPSVKSEISGNLYSELEPLPTTAEDLSTLVSQKPSGPVSVGLKWEGISAENFERLLFNLVGEAEDYANSQWLTHTDAPDRGRDISAERVSSDSLTGQKHERVIFQAKHWLTKSVGVGDVADAVAKMKLNEPPVVKVLVIATSGHFTADAVAWIDKHNDSDARPRVEMWAGSHLEWLLARRPHLVAGTGLR